MDKVTARELHLFIDNDADLHRQQYTPILKNLMTKHGQGRYNPALAVKLFMYLVDAGAKKYQKQHGSADQPWHKVFPKAERSHVAQALRDDFEDEAKLGNYDDMLPKKYQGKVSGKTIGEGQEPEGEEQTEGGPLFDAETRQALAEAAGGEVTERADPPVLDTKAIAKIEKLVKSLDEQVKQAKSSLAKVKANPRANAPQAENLSYALNQCRSLGSLGTRVIDKFK